MIERKSEILCAFLVNAFGVGVEEEETEEK